MPSQVVAEDEVTLPTLKVQLQYLVNGILDDPVITGFRIIPGFWLPHNKYIVAVLLLLIGADANPGTLETNAKSWLPIPRQRRIVYIAQQYL